MGQLSDRDRLLRLIQERRKRLRALAADQEEDDSQQLAPDNDAQRRNREQLKTQAIFERCKATFDEFALEETGHILRVSMGSAAKNLSPNGIEATGGVDFALLTIDHHDQQGTCTVPLLAARYRRGKYVLVDFDRCYLCRSLAALHDRMLQLVSEMDEGYMYIVLEKFRRVSAVQPEDRSSTAASSPAIGGNLAGPHFTQQRWQPGCGNVELRAVIGGHEPPGRTQSPRFLQ